MYTIYPRPKKVRYTSGQFYYCGKIQAFFEEELENVFNELTTFMDVERGELTKSNIRFLLKKELGKQAYEMEITDVLINIYASQKVGFFYATKTLKQIFKLNMECGYIFDEPDLNTRGFMLDISRNKVPTISTIKEIITLMSDLKMNHLELYVEGFSFEYASFEEYLQKDAYISVAEYKELETYANSHYIDLVPNQNGFGHMTEWLKKDEFKELAELPEGMFLWGTHRDPSTLNPLDYRSLDLLKKLYKDMLPISNSRFFNMNFDEPFELGRGASKKVCEEKGLGNVYVDYMLKAYEEIKKYNKTPLIWGDVLIKHDDVLDRIPKDMIFVDWGYDGQYPFDKNLWKLKKSNIKFMAAPGTSSWCSFLGRTYDALASIYNACIYTHQYGGEGILLTDWGDFGHLQFWPISLPSLVYAGLLSYRVESGTYLQLKGYLNKFVFHDKENIIADLLLDLGNYYRYENNYIGNGTQTFHTLLWAIYALKEEDKITYYKAKMKDKVLSLEKYNFINKFFALKEEELKCANISSLVKDEVQYSIDMVKTLLKINISLNDDVEISYRRQLLSEVIASEESLITKLRFLWLKRNKISHLENTITYIQKLIEFTKILSGGLYEEA